MSTREALEAVLLEEQASRFFTEFYVEAGQLHEAAPRYSFGNSTSIFDLASLTKALVTGPLVHHFLAQHNCKLSDPLSAWPAGAWQKAFSSDLMNLSAEALLAHRSGLPAWRNFWMGHLNEGALPKALLKNPLIPETFARVKPLVEKADVYSDLGYILLGYALEAANLKRLDQLWSDYLFPLHIATRDLGFAPQLHSADFKVPSAYCAVRERMLEGEVHDENAAALGGIAGHAGLFGRGPSVGQYLRALAHSSEGKIYFEQNAEALSAHSSEGLLGLRRGNGQSAALFSQGQGMGHLGFVGTAFWLDFKTDRYAIFLTNRVISGRVNPHITGLRRQVFGFLNELAD